MAKKRQHAYPVATSAPGAKLSSIRAMERRIDRQIPTEFKEFLAANDGGVPSKTEVTFGDGPYQDSRVRYFFSIDGPPRQRITYAFEEYIDRIPSGFFPVACDESDNLFLLGVDGHMYYWDHEREDSEAELDLVAQSFVDFLSRLTVKKRSKIVMATLHFEDGSTVRRALPSMTFSKTRDLVVPVETLQPGEIIEEFGHQRLLVSIALGSETL